MQLGTLVDRRVPFFILPVLSFVILYSKLPHKVYRWITYLSKFS